MFSTNIYILQIYTLTNHDNIDNKLPTDLPEHLCSNQTKVNIPSTDKNVTLKGEVPKMKIDYQVYPSVVNNCNRDIYVGF